MKIDSKIIKWADATDTRWSNKDIELTGRILWKVMPRCALHESENGRCENFLMSQTEAPPVWQKLPSRSFKEGILRKNRSLACSCFHNYEKSINPRPFIGTLFQVQIRWERKKNLFFSWKIMHTKVQWNIFLSNWINEWMKRNQYE